MRKRFNYGYDRKHFNENLNPLYGWLRSCIGKNWNKCYSELRKKFDARSTINDHILQHLWQSITVDTYVDEKGRVMVKPTNYSTRGDIPVSESGFDYYVCPKSGMVRETHKKTYKQIRALKEAKERQEKAKVERWIDDDNVLRFIDGVWYHFEVRDVPQVTVTYEKPFNKDTFLCGSWNKKVEKRWEEMNAYERKDHGTKRVVGQVRDVFTNELMGRHQEVARYGRRGVSYIVQHGKARYHATKKTASHKALKQVGVAS
jgi:hypothetical protein